MDVCPAVCHLGQAQTLPVRHCDERTAGSAQCSTLWALGARCGPWEPPAAIQPRNTRSMDATSLREAAGGELGSVQLPHHKCDSVRFV